MGNDDRLRLDTSAARRHLADVPKAIVDAARDGSNVRCVDCGGEPAAGGLRCLPCFGSVANPKSQLGYGSNPEAKVPYVNFQGAA